MLRKALLVLLLLASTASAQEGIVLLNEKDPDAFDPRPPIEVVRTINELADWLAHNSNFAPMQNQPAVIYVRQEELQYLYFTGSSTGYTGQTEPKVEALYMHNTILLREDFKVGEQDQILLHELVHHLQWEQNVEYPCLAASEKPAYDLQTKWQEEHGDPQDERPNPLWVFLATMCDEGSHH